MYAIWHGPEGLKAIATRVNQLAAGFARALESGGVPLAHAAFFDTVTAIVPGKAESIKQSLADAGYLVRAIGADKVVVSFGEQATWADVTALAHAFGVNVGTQEPYETIPATVARTTATLTHPIFSSVHSETQMLRYLRGLKDKDLALDRTMIPLGSCTMKLNPTTGMEPITWPEFANIHPFAPASQTQGWRELIGDLETWLAEITGYAKVSLQPNAGSQGEYAGLNAIRRYHLSRGDDQRDIILIPQSAHGTNAASAALANLRVVVVATAADGSIDVADLDAKLAKHEGHVAGIMITYPSTHGVFEETVTQVCAKVHAAGGQVYIDGANLNALAGVARPGEFGGDVSHLNLHKTFTIPHGGGGPGVGPVAVASHLVPFLPTDPAAANPFAADDPTLGVPVASSLYGSAGVLPITWAYIAMMGGEGLANATFPVAGTLMVEPTESEDLGELDRFIAAMKTIREEIREIERGEYAYEESVLAHAPFSAESATTDEWDHSFTRAKAAYPVSSLRGSRGNKYFPPVRRLNEAYGDRNFICSCPPPEAFDGDGDGTGAID